MGLYFNIVTGLWRRPSFIKNSSSALCHGKPFQIINKHFYETFWLILVSLPGLIAIRPNAVTRCEAPSAATDRFHAFMASPF